MCVRAMLKLEEGSGPIVMRPYLCLIFNSCVTVHATLFFRSRLNDLLNITFNRRIIENFNVYLIWISDH